MKLILKLKNGLGIFLCDNCGREVEKNLSNGLRQQYCSIICRNKKHGGSYTRIYQIYYGIKKRCLNIKHKFYQYYGGRGIKVCPEWMNKKSGFINFRDWALNNNYQDNLIIDRIDNNGDYSPQNCRWITQVESSQNRRTTKLNKEKVLEIRRKYRTGNYTQKELGEEFELNQSYISAIINKYYWKNT